MIRNTLSACVLSLAMTSSVVVAVDPPMGGTMNHIMVTLEDDNSITLQATMTNKANISATPRRCRRRTQRVRFLCLMVTKTSPKPRS